MQERTAQVDGIRMRWLEAGEGVPVVFVHGIPTGPALWREVVPRLQGVRALAWEMVGYGASIPEGRGRDISVGRQAVYLLSWLDAVGLERPVLAGHDLGGGVIQIAAVRRRERCAGLFLTNAVGYDSWPVAPVKAARATGALFGRLPDLAFRRVFGTMIRLGHDDRHAASDAIRIHWRPYAENDGAAAFVRQTRSLHVQDTLAVKDDLPRLNVPARVVWGAADFFQKVRYGEYFARDLGTELVRLEGARHFTPEDHPDVIAREVNGLARDVDV